MSAALNQYIAELNRLFKTGNATEHSYRPAFQRLLECLIPAPLLVTNEPKRQECGAPDYIITNAGIPVGYIETKDVGADLNNRAYKEQFDRYRLSLGNLIITNYLTFKFYRRSNLSAEISIGAAHSDNIISDKAAFTHFTDLVNSFTQFRGEIINTSEQLSKVMASKARLMANIVEKSFTQEQSGVTSIYSQMLGFRQILIPDISESQFADVYSQTIAYGMFAAKMNATDSTNFNRSTAAHLIPHSNPFLRKLFQYIAGFDLDERIRWVVDDLADLFNLVDVAAINSEFVRLSHDPMIHFYETFLSEYDPEQRKSRGVWYTPLPVVQFIVRAVDDILKQDFGLHEGLTDASKLRRKHQIIQADGTVKIQEKEYHRVQILDPATGTGTFLAEVVRFIFQSFLSQKGMWQGYAAQHLIPRINGFEILMASYAMAHLKLDMLLQQTGYKHSGDERLNIFLTNSLDKAREKTEIPFAQWLCDEANEASRIKQDVPVMIVLGNPPYSGESQNSGEWMNLLLNDYKKEPSGGKLQERNSKWINDDYVKFIRFGQHFIKETGEGVLAFINNHSFLDNPTFRGMRYNLLKTFDKIYIIDLHGNVKKKETASDGSKDENVFNIQQGVSINIFIKTSKPAKSLNSLATVFHADLYGLRSVKYDFLNKNTLQSVAWQKLELSEPYFFFVPKNFSLQDEYRSGFSVQEIFPVNGVGITTAHDDFVINSNKEVLEVRFNQFKNSLPIPDDLHAKFNVNKKEGWDIVAGWRNLQNVSNLSEYIQVISYRPFDNRLIFYEDKLVWRCVKKVMHHFLRGDNVGLIVPRQAITDNWSHIQVSNAIVDNRVHYSNKGIPIVIPLYLYPNSGKLIENAKRQPNLNESIIKEIEQFTGLQFIEEPAPIPSVPAVSQNFSPYDVLDYIYAVLHSPTYRERYKEFLKIDFPRVPFPQDAARFWQLVNYGAQLRRLHLMDNVLPITGLADYPIEGDHLITELKYAGKKVFINRSQYFNNVPAVAWEFFIGGYQPAQKWLKDRKGSSLQYDDILHYRKIIRILKETAEIMNQIDELNLF